MSWTQHGQQQLTTEYSPNGEKTNIYTKKHFKRHDFSCPDLHEKHKHKRPLEAINPVVIDPEKNKLAEV